MLLPAGLLHPTALLLRHSANIFKAAAIAPIKSPHLRPSCRECLREPCLHGGCSPTATSDWEPLNISTGSWCGLTESSIRCVATERWRFAGVDFLFPLRLCGDFRP